MTIPKSESTREKWNRCTNCNGTHVACRGLARDRGYGCCKSCTHEEEETNATE